MKKLRPILSLGIVLFVTSCNTLQPRILPEHDHIVKVPVHDSTDEFFCGSGSAEIMLGDKSSAFEKAKQLAMQDACELIICRVNAQKELYQEETTSSLVERFVSRTTIDTNVELADVRVLKRETNGRTATVQVGISKSVLRNIYRQRIRNAYSQLADDFELAENMASTTPKRSLHKYQSCMTTLRQLDDDLKVYLTLNSWQNDIEKLLPMVSRREVERKLGELADKVPEQENEIAEKLASELLKTNYGSVAFAIYPIEYENTGFVSAFGNRLTELIAAYLSKNGKWKRVDDLAEAKTVLRGKLLVAGKGMNVVVACTGQNPDIIAQSYVAPISCENIGWENIKPEKLDEAIKDKIALNTEIKSDSRLRLDLRTDKLTDGPIVYRYGDRPKVAIKANRSCYVRLIYIFSDGTKLLLLDNFRISNDMANEWQKLPINWEVCEPSGVEQMLVQATVDEKMPPLNIKRNNLGDGFYQDVIVGDLSEAVMLTRGAKQFKEDPIITEIPYQWTIFEK